MQEPSTGCFVDVVEFVVEEGKVREIARAIGTQDEVHTCPTIARERGLSAIPATATHVVVSLHQRDQRGWVAALGLDIERVVVGGVRWVYRRPLVVGDRVVGTRRVTGDEVRSGRGGEMRLLTLETDFVDEDGEIVVTQYDTVVERPGS